ncbi:alkylation response protein AidB-like acyl-CoA dehydrogenase [Bradyrhizobium sp. i1.4.4]
MAIDFTLSPAQRALQLQSRKFAAEVLAGAGKAELLATPEERFLATKPTYEAMVAAGYLRKCIPAPAGGDNAGLIDMAILAEEFYAVNPSVTLTMLGTVLGLLPILLGGTRGAMRPPACTVPEDERRSACGLLLLGTRRQRQCCRTAAGRGRAHHRKTRARQLDHQRPQEMGVVRHRVGSQWRRRVVRGVPDQSRRATGAGCLHHCGRRPGAWHRVRTRH